MGTPFYLALFAQQLEAAGFLLESGANPNAVGALGSAVLLAVLAGDPELLRLILIAGGDPNQIEGPMPLITAAAQGRSDLVDVLLAHSAKIDAVDGSQRTALHRAAEKGDLDTIARLLEAGADPLALTDIGKPPIHYAALHGHSDVVNLLKREGWKPRPVENIESLIETASATQGKAEYDGICLRCHPIERDRYYIGPEMAGSFGRPIGGIDDFSYSPVMAAAEGQWDIDSLNQFIAQPMEFLPGTTMDTPGIAEPKRRADIVAYLASISN